MSITKDITLVLEQILFMPSPILEELQAYLSTRDVIALTGVCKRWRAYLVPNYGREANDRSEHENPTSWHPLLRSIRLSSHSFVQKQRILFEVSNLRCWPEDKRALRTDSNYVRCDISPLKLIAIFGSNYLSTAITKIHLDGSSLNIWDGTALEFIFECDNLVELSFRWCSYVEIDDLAKAFLEKFSQKLEVVEYDEDEEGIDDDYDSSEDDEYEHYSSRVVVQADGTRKPIPPKLKRLWFWGVGFTALTGYKPDEKVSGELVKIYRKLQECARRLMEKFETDVQWCENEVHKRHGGRSSEWWNKRLHEKIQI
ncbi:hypothetical protein TWF718_003999 [Orbilia javanica]|uniref:F-box domain-containing protein n=1 Tax=Orbilia javanica TaxID=47235 RepID=A0AAN8RKM2_9PEZI